MDNLKVVRDVFSDYKTENEILLNSTVLKVNLYKKSKKIELFLKTSKDIDLDEVNAFENYLIEKFKLDEAHINFSIDSDNQLVEVSENAVFEKIKRNWEKIVNFIAEKKPIIKAFIDKTKVEITQKLNVYVLGNSIDILKKERIDSYISNFIFNYFGKKLEVCFVDGGSFGKDIVEENNKIISNHIEQTNKACEENKARQAIQENTQFNGNSGFKKATKNTNFKQNDGNESQSNNGGFKSQGNFTPQPKKSDDPKLIYGRNHDKNMPSIKINEINTETGLCKIIGTIVKLHDPTELKKTGKFLLSFDVYDRTTTMTCKAFVFPEQKKETMGRLSEGTGVEVVGKSRI